MTNHPNRNGKFELSFVGGTSIRYRRFHRTFEAAEEVAYRVLAEMEDRLNNARPGGRPRAAHPAIIDGPGCGRDGVTIR